MLRSGNIVPNGNLNLATGYSWTKGESKRAKAARLFNNQKIRDALELNLDSQMAQNRALEQAMIKTAEGRVHLTVDSLEDASLKDKVKTINRTNAISKMPPAYLELAKMLEKGSAKRAKVERLATDIQVIADNYNLDTKAIEEKIDITREEYIRSYWAQRHLIYGIVGASASKFTLVKDPNNIDFDKRFEATKFQSWKIGAGYNVHFSGKSMVGASITYQRANNFFLLDDAEYTRTTASQISSTVSTTMPVSTTVITDRTESKKTITAYDGSYGTYRQLAFNLDYVQFFPGQIKEETNLAINYYLRQQFSTDSKVQPEVTNLGVGAYFFKNSGAFLGGIYVELPDVFNNIERNKVNPTLKPFYGRITFGVVTKFSIASAFNSIIAYQ